MVVFWIFALWFVVCLICLLVVGFVWVVVG